jgi:O-methyltransferase involved in polyketide biosynthesis
MKHGLNIEIGDIQKTLFLPLWGRAVETVKSEPRLQDLKAVSIINQLDMDFSQAAENIDDLTKIAWIMRSLICDQVINNFCSKYPDATVVNIGCGLDTTYDRVDNGRLRWYDLDLPDVIELRKLFIQEEERRTFIASSFLEQAWLDQVTVRSNVLFVAAGVAYYFEPEKIKIFFQEIAGRFPDCEVIFDVASELGVKIANKKVIDSSGLDERSYLIWGLKRVKEILDWDPRIQLIRKYAYFRSFRLSLRNTLMGALSDLLGIQYMLHLRFKP